jgi:hypothetical protein
MAQNTLKLSNKYSFIILLKETKLFSKILCVILLLFHPKHVIKYFMPLSSELVDQYSFIIQRVHQIGNTGEYLELTCNSYRDSSPAVKEVIFHGQVTVE